METPSKPVAGLNTTVNYYATVQALTLKDGTQTLPPKVITNSALNSIIFSPLLIYGSVIFFFLLFIAGMVLQIIYRVLDWKKSATIFFIALMVASTPMALRLTLSSTDLQTRAGPDEVPRNLKVLKLSDNSFAISWTTEIIQAGAVKYGPAPLSDKNSQVIISNNNMPGQNHSVFIDHITSDTDYEYEILSGSRWYTDNGKPLKFRLTN